jgi:AraC-like DNA-binding protein
MRYLSRVPAYPLDRYIENLWWYEDFRPDHSRERVLATATAELVIDLEARPKRLFEHAAGTPGAAFTKVWLSGAHTAYFVIEALPDSTMMGVHFRPGGAFPFAGLPMAELANRVVPADLVFGASILALRERLIEAPSGEEKLALLEAYLRAFMGRNGRRGNGAGMNGEASTARLVEALVAGAGQGGFTTRATAAALGVSQQRLIRLRKTHVGLTPKALHRIVRFGEAIERIATGAPVAWSRLSVECGYYDQAHFIHDFRAFSGFSPADYADRFVEAYPNFIPVG